MSRLLKKLLRLKKLPLKKPWKLLRLSKLPKLPLKKRPLKKRPPKKLLRLKKLRLLNNLSVLRA